MRGAGVLADGSDDSRVVRPKDKPRRAAAGAIVEHRATERQVVRIDVALRRQRDRGRLAVRAFHEPHARAQPQHAAEILARAVQVRLQAHADARKSPSELLGEVERDVDVRRLLHVDPEIAAGVLRALPRSRRR